MNLIKAITKVTLKTGIKTSIIAAKLSTKAVKSVNEACKEVYTEAKNDINHKEVVKDLGAQLRAGKITIVEYATSLQDRLGVTK